MGDPADEAVHNLRGWGDIRRELSFPPDPGADRTARFQLVRLPNLVELAAPRAGASYVLVFRTEDGTCDDSFDLFVNGSGPIYRYRHGVSGDRFPTHRVPIDASLVATTIIQVNFHNIAVDNCGYAAVFFVQLE
jgi:hypothetical protein